MSEKRGMKAMVPGGGKMYEIKPYNGNNTAKTHIPNAAKMFEEYALWGGDSLQAEDAKRHIGAPVLPRRNPQDGCPQLPRYPYRAPAQSRRTWGRTSTAF
jgi:hypothetical protein